MAFAALLLLSGCGGDSRPAPVFQPPSYGYLTKLRLNVGDVRVEDQTAGNPAPNDLSSQDPTPPAQAMRKMAEDRLLASGNSGTAVFTIDQASITGQPGGALNGSLAAHLDIIGPSGGHNGYAEAHVSRQFVPGSGTDNDGLRSQLYELTNQMMGDMNVELEYQLRRTLGDWLLDASGAPVGATVEQQTLSPAGSPTGATPTSTPLTSPGAVPAVAVPATAMPAASNSVGAPMQLAPAGSVAVPATPSASAALPVTAPPVSDPNLAGPTQLAPPPQSVATPAAAAAPQGSSPPPGFLRLPNGYLVPAGSAPASSTAMPAAAATTGATPGGY